MVPPPMKNGRPVFYPISKNAKVVVKTPYSIWKADAKEWGEDLQWTVKAALLERGYEAGEGHYQIKLGLRVKDKRRRDVHNFCELVGDSLEGVLDCDDRNFLFECLPTEIVDDKVGVYLQITRFGTTLQ